MRKKISQVVWGVIAALTVSVLVARTTVLSWGEAIYALTVGVGSALLPSGGLPLGNPGELVNLAAELALAMAEIAEISPNVATAVAAGAGGVVLISRYRS